MRSLQCCEKISNSDMSFVLFSPRLHCYQDRVGLWCRNRPSLNACCCFWLEVIYICSIRKLKIDTRQNIISQRQPETIKKINLIIIKNLTLTGMDSFIFTIKSLGMEMLLKIIIWSKKKCVSGGVDCVKLVLYRKAKCNLQKWSCDFVFKFIFAPLCNQLENVLL